MNLLLTFKPEEMKYQSFLKISWMLILLAPNSEAATNRTNCIDGDDSTVKKETQKFYCTAVQIFDDIQTVRKLICMCACAPHVNIVIVQF